MQNRNGRPGLRRRLTSSLRILGWSVLWPVAAAGAAPQSDAVIESQFIYEQAPFPQAHASTLVQTSGGRVMAAWFGGTHERHPDVCIYGAFLDADGWTRPRKLADGVQADGRRWPTWNPVLFQAPDGALILYYKVGPNPREWWGLQIRSDDGGETWSAPERLPAGILGPIKNKPVVLEDGSWLSPSSTEDGSATQTNWRLHFERSEDEGKTWTSSGPVEPFDGLDSIQPSLLFHKDGVLQAVARTRQGVLSSTWSKDGGKTWSAVDAINLPNPNSGTDAVTLADGRQLIVYNDASHRPETPGKGHRWPLDIALSDDGVRWRKVLTLETEPLKSGYAYPAVIQTRDGRVHISYTWGRVRIKHVVLDPGRL